MDRILICVGIWGTNVQGLARKLLTCSRKEKSAVALAGIGKTYDRGAPHFPTDARGMPQTASGRGIA